MTVLVPQGARRNAKPKVVLYNPPAAHYTMPLSLLAVGSALDRSRFEVRIIDARIDREPLRMLMREARDAVCVGITVLTGQPILGAIRATRALRQAAPGTAVIWGGWHPSLFPEQCIAEGGARAAVSGQGQLTFREIVERLARGRDLRGCRGCTHARGDQPTRETPRDLADVQTLPSHDYSLLRVERYFTAKRHRQLDYVSSEGCPFRCSFCADPAVYQRRWTGLGAARIVEEIARLYRQYRFDDVAFQDETFFTKATRVAEMCEGFLAERLRLTWTATMRADQGARLDEGVWPLLRRSGLRRVLVGVESGDPEMLRRIEKDITLDQVYTTAARCRRHGIAGIFPFILGMPGETEEAAEATFDCARRLREMDPSFEVHMFFYTPYPGNPLAARLAESGFAPPQTLNAWARFDLGTRAGPWIHARLRRQVEAYRFYLRTGFSNGPWWRAPQRMIARLRCRHRRLELPIEQKLVDWIKAPLGET